MLSAMSPRLRFQLPRAGPEAQPSEAAAEWARVEVHVCREAEPVAKQLVRGCTNTLFGFDHVQHRAPGAVQQWLFYHLEVTESARARSYYSSLQGLQKQLSHFGCSIWLYQWF